MKKSIFTKLVGCFIAVIVLLFIDYVLLILIELGASGGMNSMIPDNNVDADGNIINLTSVTDIGGWVEELDENNAVIAVSGEKRTDKKSYTADEIYELTSLTGKSEWLGFMVKAKNSGRHFLFIYSRDTFEFTPTIVLNREKGTVSSGRSKVGLTVLLIIVLIQIFGISYYLRRKIKRPLKQLSEGMTRIQSGESGVVLDIRTEAEFSQIVDTFNSMTAELERQKAENKHLVEQKNRLLLDLSHDLRTPIATIKSYANALEAGLVPPDKLDNYYKTIEMKADRVQVLSEDMFFMLKTDDPDDKLNTENTDICEFLRMLCAEYYDELTDAGFDFDINICDGPCYYPTDKRLFARVIGNLLTNAKKYDLTGNTIAIVCTASGGNIIIQVKDDGNEISPDLAQQMFTPFVRGDKTRSSVGGTGLGLSISKKIVEKHGGTLTFRREDGMNVFEIVLNKQA